MSTNFRREWSKAEWAAAAKEGVLRVLGSQYAVTQPELEGRLSEAYHLRHVGNTIEESNIDPHHITTALRKLREAGTIEEVVKPTRGGRTIRLIIPAERKGINTKIDRAAARKRLLMTRYITWTQGTAAGAHGTVGPAGEQAVRAALDKSGGMQPLAPGFEAVGEILGVAVRGAVDSGGYAVIHNENQVQVVTLMVEVKNIRSWLYPSSAEIYQCLDKAREVWVGATVAPKPLILPVIVCRRAHPTTFWMAGQLGFLVVDTMLQHVGNQPEDKVLEVSNELAYKGLRTGAEAPTVLVNRFKQGSKAYLSLPALATKWSETVSALGSEIKACRQAQGNAARAAAVNRLREQNHSLRRQGGW